MTTNRTGADELRTALAAVADAVRLAHLRDPAGRCLTAACGWWPCLSYDDGLRGALLADDPATTVEQLQTAFDELNEAVDATGCRVTARPARECCHWCGGMIRTDELAGWVHDVGAGSWRCEDADTLAEPSPDATSRGTPV